MLTQFQFTLVYIASVISSLYIYGNAYENLQIYGNECLIATILVKSATCISYRKLEILGFWP